MITFQGQTSKLPLLWALSLMAIVWLMLFVGTLLYPEMWMDNKKTDTTLTVHKNVSTPITSEQLGIPTRLRIPKINVDTVVESVGLTLDDAMDVPKNYKHTAWYNGGPRPGQIGSAVINGHYSWVNGVPTVFADLHLLRYGDTIQVEDQKGIITTFVVKSLQTFKENSDAATVFSSNDGKAHLNIITCQWLWNNTTKRYPYRLVVFADAVIL